MPLLSPRLMLDRMTDVSPSLLHGLGLSALLLDIDNTMTTHDNPVPADGVQEWIDRMRAEGFALMVVSNNTEERVRPFARLVGLDFVSGGRKPLPSGYRRACRQLGVRPSQTAVIGDQIFTDVLGGNLLGAYTILTVPYKPETQPFLRFKRVLERPLLRAFRRRAGRTDPRKK